MSERKLKLVVEYDGSAYAGWQEQLRGPRTVQGELVGAVERIVRHPVVIHGAGRTDRGVHALGQVASLTTSRSIAVSNFQRALNSYLPPDIAIRSVSEVDPGFHARFSALGKHYRYTILRSPVRRVFASEWSVRHGGPLDVPAMRSAAGDLVGCQDFAAFATRSGNPPRTTWRTVHSVSVTEREPFVLLDVIGRGFLYTMVRTMAGTLLEVGEGKRSRTSLRDVLGSRERSRAGPTSPPQGLCLVRVFYEQDEIEATLARHARGIIDVQEPPWLGPPEGRAPFDFG